MVLELEGLDYLVIHRQKFKFRPMFQNLKTKIGFNIKGSTLNRKKKRKYLECRARKERLVIKNIAYNRKK